MRRPSTWILLAGLLWTADAHADGAANGATQDKKKVDLLLGDPRLLYRDGKDGPTVPPDWSAVRREIESHFHPTRTMITEASKPKVLARQLTSAPAPSGGQPGQVYAPDENVEAQEQTEAIQQAYERPASTRTTEITVTTDPHGRIVSATVSSSSGSLHFDEAAMQAVREAVAERSPDDDRQAVMTRWRIRAAYGVTLPRAQAPLIPKSSNTRQPARGMPLLAPVWGTFDESSGRGQLHRAFADKIETEIKLLSITPVTLPTQPE